MYYRYGFSIRDWSFVRSRELVSFSECPFREVLLYYLVWVCAVMMFCL